MSAIEVTPYSVPAKKRVSIFPIANSTPMHDISNTKNSISYNSFVYNNLTIIQQVREKKKPSKRVINATKTTSTVTKSSGKNKKVGNGVVWRILEDINMTKYSQKFKNYDLEKFKEIGRLDLNAMGITRFQELNKFEEAISKAKKGFWN